MEDAGTREIYQHSAPLSYVTQRVPLFITTSTANLNANNAGFAGFNVRQGVPASSFATNGTPIRLTLTPPSAGTSTVIGGLWVGTTTSFPDFSAAPTQVLFSGSSTVTLTAGGAVVVSDSIGITLQSSLQFMASFAITSGDIRFNTGGQSSWTNYFHSLASSQSSNTLNPGSGTIQNNSAGIISLIQAMG